MVVMALALSAAVRPALASNGGPDLVESLGWNPATREIFFRVHHVNESGDAPTILRLSLSRGTGQFQPLKWSVDVRPDSTYRAKARALTRPLAPLHERSSTTIPQEAVVAILDTLKNDYGLWPHYRVRVTWFNGVCKGWVEANTYRDTSVRMIRLYQVPGREDLVGVFSFRGIPSEFGYEIQAPVLLPTDKRAVVRIGPE